MYKSGDNFNCSNYRPISITRGHPCTLRVPTPLLASLEWWTPRPTASVPDLGFPCKGKLASLVCIARPSASRVFLPCVGEGITHFLVKFQLIRVSRFLRNSIHNGRLFNAGCCNTV